MPVLLIFSIISIEIRYNYSPLKIFLLFAHNAILDARFVMIIHLTPVQVAILHISLKNLHA